MRKIFELYSIRSRWTCVGQYPWISIKWWSCLLTSNILGILFTVDIKASSMGLTNKGLNDLGKSLFRINKL